MSDPIAFEGATPRFALPLLFAGQSQREFFVNEAMVRTDALLHCAIEGAAQTPPSAPSPGQSWRVLGGGQAEFAGHDDTIALWTEGGWRFIEPRPGTRAFNRSSGAFELFDGSWVIPTSPVAPQGGATIDAEARSMLVNLLETLAAAGVFATN